MSGVLSPVMRNGFPFPIENGELWDGVSWHRIGYAYDGVYPDSASPYAGLSIAGRDKAAIATTDLVGDIYSFIPAVGTNTPYPIGLSLKELARWYWRIRQWRMNDGQVSGPVIPFGALPESPHFIPAIYSFRADLETDLVRFINKIGIPIALPAGFDTSPFIDDPFADEYFFADFFDDRVGTGPENAQNAGVVPRVVRVGNLYYPNIGANFVWAVTQATQIQFKDLITAETTVYGGDADTVGATASIAYNHDTSEFTVSAAGNGDGTYSQSGTFQPFKYYTYNGIYDEDTGNRV